MKFNQNSAIKKANIAAAIFAISISSVCAQNSIDIREVVPFLSDLPPLNDYSEQIYFIKNYATPKPGTGWNSFLGEGLQNTCVTGSISKLETIEANKGDIQIINDKESFFSNVGISASGSYLAFSGSGTFNQSIEKTRNQQLVIAHVDRATGNTSWDAPAENPMELSDWVKKLLKKKSSKDTNEERLQRFREACGDSYVLRTIFGTFWLGRFAYEQSANEIATEITAKAKGSFGVGSAKASAVMILKTNSENQRTEASSQQLGGASGKPVTNSQEMWNQYQDLLKSNTTSNSPYKIVVRSYRSSGLLGWPNDLQDVYLPTVSSLQILGHSERLDALAKIYKDAASELKNYYFPFTSSSDGNKARQELADSSDSLSHAAACLRNIESYCLVKSVCSTDVFKKKQEIAKICPALLDSTPQFGNKVANLMLASNNQDAQLEIAKFVFGLTGKKVPANALLEQLQEFSGDTKRAPALVYYELLAKAPMRRDRERLPSNIETALSPSDESYSFDVYCKALGFSCTATSLNDVNASNDIKNYLRNWVLRVRLLPLAQMFDKAEHPMHVSQSELLNLVNSLSVELGESRNFTPLQLPPPKPIQAQPAPAAPKYRPLPCTKGLRSSDQC